MKIRIFNNVEAGHTENEVNDFIKDKDIVDIQYRPDTRCNNVMVLYRE